MKRWIWQYNNYPHFTYNFERLEQLLQKISMEQGYLLALTQTMSKDTILQRQCDALLNETLSTAAIEGEILNRDSVKASIAKKFGLKEIDDKKIIDSTDNLVAILIDANTNYDKDLTLERLFGWHNALFPKGYSGLRKINTATFRGEETMLIVGGAIGREVVYYEAPPRQALDKEMQRFLEWFNTEKPSLIKASIAHLWFVIIHPFDDGNGRITRAITDLVLSNIENSKISRLYSMSSAINENKKAYYSALEYTTGYIKKVDNHLDITFWCEWFLNTLYQALLDAKGRLNHIVFKTKFWDKHRDQPLNARQIKVLNFILDIGIENFKGNLSKKKYMSITDTASTTASRDIVDLLEFGCIEQIEGTAGRNVGYRIVL
ncbi:Fic family protein [Sulfurospirillum diekertiae]|uniref:Fic family protein n=1 Tax=Sulfurospirillum diekertiae TaxID=1854492 RepID=A0A6G9VQP9_9BACT|nr:Fic family protein [Sulfurospirillum diekertiae]QIR75856.1 Fic family protein [Sulfurospirillum diekertiae]QIR78495.1 Fic family protein [Sulfurospirillum diekertiae]